MAGGARSSSFRPVPLGKVNNEIDEMIKKAAPGMASPRADKVPKGSTVVKTKDKKA